MRKGGKKRMFKKMTRKLKELSREQLKKIEDISETVSSIANIIFLFAFAGTFALNEFMKKPIFMFIFSIIALIAAIILTISILCYIYADRRRQKL